MNIGEPQTCVQGIKTRPALLMFGEQQHKHLQHLDQRKFALTFCNFLVLYAAHRKFY